MMIELKELEKIIDDVLQFDGEHPGNVKQALCMVYEEAKKLVENPRRLCDTEKS